MKRRTWRATLAANLMLGVGFAVVAFNPAEPATVDIVTPEAHAEAQRLDRIIDRHGCWTGDAPADVWIPGHVVVTGAHGPRYAGSQAVHEALEGTYDGTVHAFCR